MRIGLKRKHVFSLLLSILMIAAVAFCGIAAAEVIVQKRNIIKALAFLRSQIKSTGLIDSYIEDNVDYSYTYDDALAAMAFISAGRVSTARRILDAFLKISPEPEGGFLHRYDATTGNPIEGILAVGHNAYLLQAMNLYYIRTKDPRYNTVARGIADYILSQQALDGGIYGRAGVTWKSTENNLAAFSAIHNFGTVQKQPYYTSCAKNISVFVKTECWDGTRFLCGENDPMITTDSQALGAMILGPAYKNGAYWVRKYTRNAKRYKPGRTVTGFDQNVDRDTVWVEGTLQQAMAYVTVKDAVNFNFYKAEAEKLFQPSGALWVASNEGTTGFGDCFQRWQAVAPTAWYVYVYTRNNIMSLYYHRDSGKILNGF